MCDSEPPCSLSPIRAVRLRLRPAAMNWWTRARCLRREARDLYSEGPDGSRPRIDPRKQQRVVVLRHHAAMTGETPLEARCTSGVGHPAVGAAVRVGDGGERTTCRVFELGATIDEVPRSARRRRAQANGRGEACENRSHIRCRQAAAPDRLVVPPVAAPRPRWHEAPTRPQRVEERGAPRSLRQAASPPSLRRAPRRPDPGRHQEAHW